MAGINSTLSNFDERIRKIERQLEKCELREKQIIVMLKMIIEKSIGTRPNHKISIQDIINFMEKVVSNNESLEESRQPADLISELIKKGM